MNLENMRVTLVGLGRSSVAAARLLRQKGARPFISDADDTPKLEKWLDQATAFGIPCEIGGHSPDAFAEAQLIIVSPGVPITASCLDQPRARGIPILGELEFAARFCTARILALTGTNGKTTATSLLENMVKCAGHTVALAGNNDTPLSQVMLETTQPEYVVLEVSSYQLETTVEFHPAVAGVLNLTVDHLARHGSMPGYADTKARIFMRQQPGDAAVLNADDPLVAAMTTPVGVERFFFSLEKGGERTLHVEGDYICCGQEPIAPMEDNPLPGRHNLANVLACLAVMKAAGFPWEGPLEGLRSFEGVEHRIEFVLKIQDVDYYNDSKSTNMDSLRVALQSFSRPVVLIAGGRGKGGDYTELNALVKKHVKHLVLIGEDAPKMEAAFGTLTPATRSGSMMDAVRTAQSLAQAGDVILLSPACASFDMYDNFEARGRDFKECVLRLAEDRETREEPHS